MTDLVLFLIIMILPLLFINYLISFVKDYIKWNHGISPNTYQPWDFMGQDGFKTRFYSDGEYNIISIKTIADKF